MTRRLILIAALVVVLAGPAWGGFDEGHKAAECGDYETAMREFRPLAEQGHAEAQAILGNIYYAGAGGVLQDLAEAVRWYRKAAEQGLAEAQGSLRDESIEDGVRNAPCGADAYGFEWQGQRLTADWHVKNGGNTRYPGRCLRIYYTWEPNTQQIVISDMPAHQRTGAT